MMKIIKKIMIILMLFSALFINFDNVYAASSTISVKSSSKTVVVGNTFKVTVTVSSGSSLGGWEFDVKYDTSKLSLVSSNLEGKTNSVGYFDRSGNKSKSYTMTFKAKSSGSAKIYVKNSLVYGWDEKEMSTTDGSYTVNIITQQELEASYSKDNNLKSLSVSGYDLKPDFNKKTTEYSLELENDVREIKVSAKANDSKADVSGTGTHKLSEGQNKITVRVTAENGNVKNYIINVLVKELNPINVIVNNQDYTVVRKTEEIEYPTTFEPTTTTIDGEEVPAFKSDITGYLLVALKDEDGNISLFIYDNGEYTLYEEKVFSGITLYMVSPDVEDIPEGYELTTMSINGSAMEVYKKGNFYPLIYGVNIQTGKTNWYTLEETEMTLQLYKAETNKEEVVKSSNDNIILIAVLGSVSFILLIFTILLSSKVRKNTIKKIAN